MVRKMDDRHHPLPVGKDCPQHRLVAQGGTNSFRVERDSLCQSPLLELLIAAILQFPRHLEAIPHSSTH
jgi:hypothetical protein